GVVITSQCVRWQRVGNVLWEIREDRFVRMLLTTRIVCHEIEGDQHGWSAEGFYEADNLQHVTCPLEFLDEVRTKSIPWRDRVWQHHEAELTKAINARRIPA